MSDLWLQLWVTAPHRTHLATSPAPPGPPRPWPRRPACLLVRACLRSCRHVCITTTAMNTAAPQRVENHCEFPVRQLVILNELFVAESRDLMNPPVPSCCKDRAENALLMEVFDPAGQFCTGRSSAPTRAPLHLVRTELVLACDS